MRSGLAQSRLQLNDDSVQEITPPLLHRLLNNERLVMSTITVGQAYAQPK